MNLRIVGLTLLLILIGLNSAVIAEQPPPITENRTPITDNGDTIVITAEDISIMQAHKMADVLNHVPGVAAGDSSVSIHGVYKVKVLVDGRPINDPTSSHGSIKWDIVSPNEVERIEILRGKGGLRYGQDASGGVILITTKKAQHLNGSVKAYGGNYGAGYGYANLQLTSGAWSAGVNGSFETTDGYKINNDKERWQTGARLAYTFDDKKDVLFTADYLEDERGSSGQPSYPTPNYRKSSDNSVFSLRANWQPVTSTTFYNEGKNHNTDPSRNLDQVLRVSELGEDLTTTVTTGNWGELNVGGALRFGKASGSNFDTQEESTYSVFGDQSVSWLDGRWKMTAGLRANFNSEFDNSINPELKLTYNKKIYRISAAYSRSNNTPSFRQRYNETSSTQPNPDLDMETADNYSLVFFVQPKKWFSSSVSFFYNRLSDRITYVTGDDGIGTYENFGLVTYTGGDLAFRWKILENVKLRADYTYLEAVDEETDLWVTAKPKHKAKVDLFWTPIQSLSVVLNGKYVSKIYRSKDNTESVPEYWIANVKAEYSWTKISLFTEINNVFDKTYYYADGLLAEPLVWIVGVNLRL